MEPVIGSVTRCGPFGNVAVRWTVRILPSVAISRDRYTNARPEDGFRYRRMFSGLSLDLLSVRGHGTPRRVTLQNRPDD